MYIIGYFSLNIDDGFGKGYGYYNYNLNSFLTLLALITLQVFLGPMFYQL